jgi:hypothetical protein
MLSSDIAVEPTCLRKAHISEDDTHAKSIASSVEGCKVLSMNSAGGDSGLPPTDVVNAGASEESTVSTVAGRGPAVVEGGARCRSSSSARSRS